MIDEETNTLIAHWYLGTADARAFSDWAVSQLEQGRDSKNLGMLAAMFDATVVLDVEDHFRRSFNELRWELPPRGECVERYAKHIASEIVEGKIKPAEGCVQLANLYYLLEHPAFLSDWHGVYWAGEDLRADEFDELIIEEARAFVAGKTPDHEELYVRIRAERKAFQQKGLFKRLWQGLFG